MGKLRNCSTNSIQFFAIQSNRLFPAGLDQELKTLILKQLFFFVTFFKVGKIYAILKRQTTRIKLPKHLYIFFAGVSISSLWPATAIKAFVTDKLGTPPSVMRTPDVFADAVLGIAEEKSDKWVWKFGSLVFCGLKVVHIWKQKDFLVKPLLLLFTMCFTSLSSDVQRTWTFLFFQVKWLGSYRWGLSENHRHIGLLQVPLWPGCGATQNDAT